MAGLGVHSDALKRCDTIGEDDRMVPGVQEKG